MSIDSEDILDFWFTEIGPERWFAKDSALDEAVRSRFLEAHEMAARGELKSWEETPGGMLALMLLLDVWPRRMFPNTPRAYATDDLALELARAAIIHHFDDRIDRTFKLLFYLPFSHAENLGDQRLAVYYVHERTKDPDWINAAEAAQETIQLFGRFPRRNAALGRESTLEEQAYLSQESSATLDFD